MVLCLTIHKVTISDICKDLPEPVFEQVPDWDSNK